MRNRKLLAAIAATLALGACSQKDPTEEAITAAENALNAVYEEAEKYVPERYAEVKKASVEAIAAYADDVRTKAFPGPAESYHLAADVAETLGLYGSAD